MTLAQYLCVYSVCIHTCIYEYTSHVYSIEQLYTPRKVAYNKQYNNNINKNHTEQTEQKREAEQREQRAM